MEDGSNNFDMEDDEGVSQDGDEGPSLHDAEDSEGSSELTASEEETSWISWFTSLRGNDFFCVVDEDYIQDEFNLTGLSAMVPYYDYALDMLLDIDIPIDKLSEFQQGIVETAAEVLYGLIHARFILTTKGMQKMLEKFQKFDFGRCPRIYCQGQAALPVSLSDVPRIYSVNVYCPKCQDLFYPRSTKQANLDGAYFGTTFAHLFLLLHPELIPPRPHQSYVPRHMDMQSALRDNTICLRDPLSPLFRRDQPQQKQQKAIAETPPGIAATVRADGEMETTESTTLRR